MPRRFGGYQRSPVCLDTDTNLHSRHRERRRLKRLVGPPRFELGTSCTPRLRSAESSRQKPVGNLAENLRGKPNRGSSEVFNSVGHFFVALFRTTDINVISEVHDSPVLRIPFCLPPGQSGSTVPPSDDLLNATTGQRRYGLPGTRSVNAYSGYTRARRRKHLRQLLFNATYPSISTKR